MSRRYKVIAAAAVVVGVGIAGIAIAQQQDTRNATGQMGLGEATAAIGQGCATALGDDSRDMSEETFDQLANNCGQISNGPAVTAQ